MKKTALISIFLALGCMVFSQDYIGEKLYNIKSSYTDNKIYGPPQFFSESNYNYLLYSSLEGDHKKAFYVNEFKVCYKYVLLSKNFGELKPTVRELNQKFKKVSRYCWEDQTRRGLTIKIDKRNQFYAVIVSIPDENFIPDYLFPNEAMAFNEYE